MGFIDWVTLAVLIISMFFLYGLIGWFTYQNYLTNKWFKERLEHLQRERETTWTSPK